MSRVPVTFRLPAFASWSSSPAGGLGLPYGRLTGTHNSWAPDPNGVSTFHTHEQRPGWAPSKPRGQRCSHDRLALSGRRLPHLNGNVPGPRSSIPSPEARYNEASSTVHSRSPDRSSPACSPRMEQEPLGTPRSFAPRRHQRRTSGWGRTLSTSPELHSRHQPTSFL